MRRRVREARLVFCETVRSVRRKHNFDWPIEFKNVDPRNQPVVLALFVLNGVFAMAELAIVSSRRSHLAAAGEERGDRERKLPSRSLLDPARMLAAVQVGFYDQRDTRRNFQRSHAR